MRRRDFLHLAIATTAIGGARPLVARGQQTGPIGANNRIRAAGLRGVTAMPARERRDSAGAHCEMGREQGHVGARSTVRSGNPIDQRVILPRGQQ